MDKSITPVNQIAVRSSTCYEFSNPNEAGVVEIEDDPVEVVERQMEDLKLNHQFNEKDVPEIFKTLINDRISGLKEFYLDLKGSTYLLIFDDSYVQFGMKNDAWTITYKESNTTIKTVDPEKSIIDHLWFVLKNPNTKLEKFGISAIQCSEAENRDSKRIDLKKLNTLLQSMIDSIDHQFQITSLVNLGFNEDTFFSLLKHVKPGTLKVIQFSISWKEEGNHQKMKKVIGMEQWKQAKRIDSPKLTSLKIEDLLHCEHFWLQLDSVTPEIVTSVCEHFFNSAGRKDCFLTSRTKNVDITAIITFLRSQNYEAEKTKNNSIHPLEKLSYKIVKSGKFISLSGCKSFISFQKN